MNLKNMRQCDNSKMHISNNSLLSICLLIMLDTLLLVPSLHCNTSLHLTALHQTTLHYTYRHFTSSHLHFITLPFGLTHLHFLSLYFSVLPRNINVFSRLLLRNSEDLQQVRSDNLEMHLCSTNSIGSDGAQ